MELSLLMPRSCLLAKDYLNHRYHAKRHAYLLHVAKCLVARGLVTERIEQVTAGGELRRPDLVVRLCDTALSLRLSVRIPAEAFATTKLGPDRNCLRSATQGAARELADAARTGASMGAAEASSDEQLATPSYNAGILADMLHHAHCCTLGGIAARAPSVGAAAALLQRWTACHSMHSEHRESIGLALAAVLASSVTAGSVVRCC